MKNKGLEGVMVYQATSGTISILETVQACEV